MVVLRRKDHSTMDEVAASIPIGRTTVYRLMGGTISNPRPAVRACVERFVRSQKERTEPADTQG